MTDAVIVSTARTPIGKAFRGALNATEGATLLGHAIGEAAKAFVKLRAGAEPFSVEDLRAFLTGKLGKHELPVAVDFVDELPRTPVGKLSRHELRMQQSSPQAIQPKQQLAQ